jgi:hypothetical protein
MLPGPNYVYKCPTCSILIKNRSLMSGNTVGAEWYSDGKQIAPMLPEFPNLTKCEKCNSIFWLHKLKEIGTFDWGDNDNPYWQNADEAEFLTIDDYFKAIDLAVAENEDEEFFIRQRIWWEFNDRLRNGTKIFVNENDESLYRGNCFALLYMLDIENDNHKITIAEIHRNLGNFEKSRVIIDSIDIPELDWLKYEFQTQIEKRNTFVFKFQNTAEPEANTACDPDEEPPSD